MEFSRSTSCQQINDDNDDSFKMLRQEIHRFSDIKMFANLQRISTQYAIVEALDNSTDRLFCSRQSFPTP